VVDIDAGRHDHRVGRDSPERPRQLPAVTRPAERVDGAIRTSTWRAIASTAACGWSKYRPPHTRPPGQLLDRETRDELGCLGGRTIRDATPSAFCTTTFPARRASASAL
jgi:hypothetical protein